MLGLMRIVLPPAGLLLSVAVLAQEPAASAPTPAAPAAADVFPRTCPNGADLPFAAIAVQHPIDTSCPAFSGDPTAPAVSQTQNKVKNNFCADVTQPKPFTPQMLIDLQAAAAGKHVTFGRGNEPADRGALGELGEGSVVRLKANLVESHYADLGGGESVNCHRPTEDENDVHIAFGPAPDTQECGSVSAEITPHYRPAAWTAFGKFEAYDKTKKKNVVDPQVASRLQAHPYRVTGQLFFDASHVPCPCGTTCPSGNPLRASLWEIHPVFKIEVCKAGAACDAANDDDWIAFDAWWNGLAPIQPVKKPHTHAAHEPRKTKPAGGGG